VKHSRQISSALAQGAAGGKGGGGERSSSCRRLFGDVVEERNSLPEGSSRFLVKPQQCVCAVVVAGRSP
jgi:hypothetical protein